MNNTTVSVDAQLFMWTYIFISIRKSLDSQSYIMGVSENMFIKPWHTLSIQTETPTYKLVYTTR